MSTLQCYWCWYCCWMLENLGPYHKLTRTSFKCCVFISDHPCCTFWHSGQNLTRLPRGVENLNFLSQIEIEREKIFSKFYYHWQEAATWRRCLICCHCSWKSYPPFLWTGRHWFACRMDSHYSYFEMKVRLPESWIHHGIHADFQGWAIVSSF